MNRFSIMLVRCCLALLCLSVLSGCATTGPGNPKDPLEGFNRAVFKFNDAVDTVALKPAATVYQKVLPSFVQTGIGNFFGNLADAWTAANNFMQGNVESGVTDTMRVLVNSTLGIGGLLDIGSEAGLQKHRKDFGLTLGKWGVAPGPYVVLPLFGPTTLRDTVALPVDLAGDPWSYVKPSRVFNVGSVVRVVDQRAAALDASGLVEDAALDRYEFIRDAYLQRRESRVRDGEQAKRDKEASANEDSANSNAASLAVPVPVADTPAPAAQASADVSAVPQNSGNALPDNKNVETKPENDLKTGQTAASAKTDLKSADAKLPGETLSSNPGVK